MYSTFPPLPLLNTTYIIILRFQILLLNVISSLFPILEAQHCQICQAFCPCYIFWINCSFSVHTIVCKFNIADKKCDRIGAHEKQNQGRETISRNVPARNSTKRRHKQRGNERHRKRRTYTQRGYGDTHCAGAKNNGWKIVGWSGWRSDTRTVQIRCNVKRKWEMGNMNNRKRLLEDIIRILSRATFEQLRKVYIVIISLKI